MSWRLLAASVALTATLATLVRWVYDLSWESAAVLAPVLVLTFGAAAGLVVLWTRVIVESLRRRRGS